MLDCSEKKKVLEGREIVELIDTNTALREPVIIQRGNTFKFVSDIIVREGRVFPIKNSLSRDEVLYEVKGHPLEISFPYELTIFGGISQLTGLGMVDGSHTLKLAIPERLEQIESRGAYRISRFPETPTVTFTTDTFDIVKAKLQDISMTGAGIRLDPRWERANNKLHPRISLIVDIRLDGGLRVSTTASIRYVDGTKLGIQFKDLSKGVKDRLFKFIVAQRREEWRALTQLRNRVGETSDATARLESNEQKIASSTGKPTALIVTENREMSEIMSASLTRKFDLIYASCTVSDIRNQLALKPNLCLMELNSQNQDQVRMMRKTATFLPPGCVLMFFGMNFDESFVSRMAALGHPEEMLVDLAVEEEADGLQTDPGVLRNASPLIQRLAHAHSGAE